MSLLINGFKYIERQQDEAKRKKINVVYRKIRTFFFRRCFSSSSYKISPFACTCREMRKNYSIILKAAYGLWSTCVRHAYTIENRRSLSILIESDKRSKRKELYVLLLLRNGTQHRPWIESSVQERMWIHNNYLSIRNQKHKQNDIRRLFCCCCCCRRTFSIFKWNLNQLNEWINLFHNTCNCICS